MRALSAQLVPRTALMLALICFWISGGAVLKHTDEPLAYRTGHSYTGHATPPATLIACAACEWEQAFSHTPPPTVHVVCLPLIRVGCTSVLPDALHLRCFDYAAPRGPPTPELS